MSVHIDILIRCNLKLDVSDSVVSTLRAMLGTDNLARDLVQIRENVPGIEDPRSLRQSWRGNGERLARLTWQYRYDAPQISGGHPIFGWSLVLQFNTIDDGLDEMMRLLSWLAPNAQNGFAGYLRGDFDWVPDSILFIRGQAYLVSHNEVPRNVRSWEPWPGPWPPEFDPDLI